MFKYVDQQGAHGACRVAIVRDGKRLRVGCKQRLGFGLIKYDLGDSPQGSVAVRFKSGAMQYCAVFGPGAVTQDTNTVFQARNASVPATCPSPRFPFP